ncbi:MAG: hypothetical protein ACE5DS_10625 [Kiloniellaceae bacterium]
MTARPERPAATAGRMPLSAHVWRSTRLAAPVMLGRAGLIVMISVDSIMTGHAGAAELTSAWPRTRPCWCSESGSWWAR